MPSWYSAIQETCFKLSHFNFLVVLVNFRSSERDRRKEVSSNELKLNTRICTNFRSHIIILRLSDHAHISV